MTQTNESKPGKKLWILTIILVVMLMLFLAYIVFANQNPLTGGAETDELAKEESALRDEIALLEQDLFVAVDQCKTNQGCTLPAIDKEVTKPVVPPDSVASPDQPPKQTMIKPKFDGSSIPATEYCPPDKIVRPKVIFVTDASPSMEWPVKANDDEMEKLLLEELTLNKQIAAAKNAQSLGLGQLGRLFPRNSPMSMDTGHLKKKLNATKKRLRQLYKNSPKRMTVAKSVLTEVVKKMSPDAEMSMLMFKSCDTIRHFPGSSAAQKKQIINTINRVKPFPIGGRKGGSPIAASLSAAAKRVKGVSAEDPAIIVMLTDGEESCKGNTCAIARSIKKTRPWLAVHLVKLGGRSKASCIAKSTGGKVYNPDSVDALAKAINEAQVTAPFELKCKKDKGQT